VNVGLRWEVIPPFYEVTGRMSEIDLNTPNPGAGSGRSHFNDTYWKEVGPRREWHMRLIRISWFEQATP
jgi:hypothetical protein